MILYRPIRELVMDSMEECKEFENLGSLIEYVVEKENDYWMPRKKIYPRDIRIAPYHMDGDKRIGWKRVYIISYILDSAEHPCGWCTDEYEGYEEVYQNWLNKG